MELRPPKDNKILFLDMNAFFASCEQHRNPNLRGKPVAVTPTAGPSGAIIAASYEAKQLGVTTGWRNGEAMRVIPTLELVLSNHRYYADIHNQIVAFLQAEVSPDIKVLSVDEFAISLDKQEQQTLEAHTLACFIQQRLERIFSPALRCSIGIGPNTFLAKLGTEIQKPNGLAIIQLHTLPLAYASLKLRDLPGINWGMATRLHSLGIKTPLEFYEAPQTFLHNALGRPGDIWWYSLHGYEISTRTNPTKSISHSHVLAPELRNRLQARAVLCKLTLKVAERLRDKNVVTQEVWVSIRTKTERWRTTISTRPTQDSFTLFQLAAHYYDQLPPYVTPYKMTVVACNLQPNTEQQTLPLFPEQQMRSTHLFQAVDTLNHRFGRWTIQPAALLPIKEAAPNRITFRQPDYEMD